MGRVLQAGLGGAVRRDRALRRLGHAAPDVSLVLVTAPAGYGKTTLLRQWAAECDCDVAWVALDELDRDAVRLVDKVVAALHSVAPLTPSQLSALVAPEASSGWSLANALATVLAARPRPFLLVVDDAHRAAGGESLRLLFEVAEAVPQGSRIAVAGRARFSPGRLRTRRRCLELGPADLAFSDAEALALLQGQGRDTAPEPVHDLVERTEGWPAGIQLASLPGSPEDAAAVDGGQGPVADYFRDEVLAGLDETSARLLLRCAALDELSGPLCDAVLATSGSAAVLAELADHQAFVVPVDRDGLLYRSHRLFGQFLLAEGRRRDPGGERLVHDRAAVWLASQGRVEEAVEQALQGTDRRAAARLVCTHAHQLAESGRSALVHAWLDEFTDEEMTDYPPLAVTAAWVWAFSGESVRAQRALLAADRGSFEGLPPDGSASIESARALARAVLAPLGVERMLGDAQRAFDLEPPGSAWRPAAALLLGCARSLNGLRREAVWPLELAASLAEQLQPSTAYFALAQRALVAAEEDDWEVAQRCADDSVRLMRQSRLERAAPSVLTHVVAAWTAVHRGDREVALAHADEALRLDRTAPITVAWSAAQASIALARVLALLGDTERARSRLEAARRQLARLVSEGTLREQLDSVHKSLFVLGGEPSLAVPTVSPAELRVLEQLPTHLSLTEIAAELHVSRNTVKSHVASLYRKLQASGRTEAVRRAREAGLLRR